LIDRLLAAEASRARLLVLAALGVYLWIFLPYLPSSGAHWGHDYALHLPNLLAGYFWFHQNGLLDAPWFSPAQCAGVPFLADLNVAYYSLPQWATFAVGPVGAIRLTFVVFAALGAAGTFVLLRGPFAATPWAAATATVLFLCSGFFTYRMLVGHLTYHAITLTPWLAWALLAAHQHVWQRVLSTCAAGLMLAYMFHAGMVHAIPPAAIAVAVILLLHGQMRGHRRWPWLLFASAALLSLALGAQRLAAALAFLQQFPRDEYALPGFPSLLAELRVVLLSLFWRPPNELAQPLLSVNLPLDRHEWEYGLGPAAALLLMAGAVRVAKYARLTASAWLVTGAIIVALALPLALNWHQPAWHAFLKSQPLLGSSSTLVRWYVLYVPLVALCAGLAFDIVVPAGPWRARAAALIAAATLAWNWTADRSYYSEQAYDPGVMQQAWQAVDAGAPLPAVTNLSVRVDKANRLAVPLERNDDMARGYSQLLCYQPMFGYGLERLRHGELRPGPALAVLPDGTLNLKNPACYVFPAANACAPGDHFRREQIEAAARFLRYQPFAFQRPAWQSFADAVNFAALLLTFAALAAAAVLAWRQHGSINSSRRSPRPR
jgi:hypothetical protein